MEVTRADMEMEVDGVEGVVMADVEATEEVVEEEEDFVVVEAEEEEVSAGGDSAMWFRRSIARRLGWIEVLSIFSSSCDAGWVSMEPNDDSSRKLCGLMLCHVFSERCPPV